MICGTPGGTQLAFWFCTFSPFFWPAWKAASLAAYSGVKAGGSGRPPAPNSAAQSICHTPISQSGRRPSAE